MSSPESAGNPLLTDWSRDGRFILMTVVTPQACGDLWVLPLATPDATSRAVVPLVHTMFNEAGASFSPDGRWIAYLSDESGRNEVYVRSFVVSPEGTPSAPESGQRLVSNGARGAVSRPSGVISISPAPARFRRYAGGRKKSGRAIGA